jgi:hypothetical protein
MARHPRLGRARSDPRLDPIRWRRPGRGSLIRLAAAAALLVMAAAVVWSRPQTCAPPLAGASASPGSQPGGVRSGFPPGGGDPAVSPGAEGSAVQPGGEGSAARPVGAGAPADQGTGGSSAVPPGFVGVPVRLAEPTALTLVRPGDRVDLLRVDDTGQGTPPVAAAALVLSVTGANDPTSGGLLLALRPAEAARAVTAPGRGFAVLIRPD